MFIFSLNIYILIKHRKKSKIKYIKIVTLENLASNPLDPIFIGHMAHSDLEISLKCYDKLKIINCDKNDAKSNI